MALAPAEKLLEEKRFTLKFIREIEKEKLYFYMLAASNPQPVLVVQSHLTNLWKKSSWDMNGVIEKVQKVFII